MKTTTMEIGEGFEATFKYEFKLGKPDTYSKNQECWYPGENPEVEIKAVCLINKDKELDIIDFVPDWILQEVSESLLEMELYEKDN